MQLKHSLNPKKGLHARLQMAIFFGCGLNKLHEKRWALFLRHLLLTVKVPSLDHSPELQVSKNTA